MAKVAIDTSALLALANPRDQYHDRAVRLASRFASEGGRWIGTALVLAELHGHLLHRRGPEPARNVVSSLLHDPAFEWVDASAALLREAIASWLAKYKDQRFSLTDAVTFEIMRRERVAIAFAFDSDFATAGFELLV